MKNRIALVTGGMGALGTSIIKTLSAGGCQAVATFQFPGDASATAWRAAMKAQGIDVAVVSCDVSDYSQTAAALAEVMAAVGPIDILVNGAGITRDNTLRKMTPDQWQAVIGVNLNSVFNVTQPLLQGMMDRGFGRIVNIASVNGQKGQIGQANYAAAKAGMHGFTKTIAQEAARKGVTVNTVSPGYIESPMIEAVPQAVRERIRQSIPVQRFGQPEDIARAVAFLVDEAAGYITGHELSVNGGLYM